MSLLWSRVSRSTICRCRSCSDVLTRIAYQPLLRRKPTFAETFTACYSGIFAFSAIVDGQFKDARRKELDKALEEALSELASLQQEREELEKAQLRDYRSRNKRTRAVHVNPDDVTVHERPPYHPSSIYGALYALVGDAGRTIDRAPTDDPYTRISELNLGVSLPHLTREALRFRARTDYISLENAVASSRDPKFNPWHAQRKAFSRRAVSAVENAAVEVVDPILHSVAYGVFKNNGSPEPMPNNIPSWLRPVWEARSEGYPWHWWRHTNSRDLTRQLIQASYSAVGPGYREYVAQVCYTLLTLRGEIEADKLNAIVLCMDRLGVHQVSKVIIGAFFHRLLTRPTQHSVVSFLNHYKVTNSPLQFYSLFRHMIADLDEGYKLFRAKIWNFRAVPWWFVRRLHIRYSLTRYKDSVLARITMTRTIVNAIMEGLLHFEMVDHAVEFFLAALDDSVLPDPHYLGLLADHCLASLNWRAAMRLVQGLATYPREVSKMLIKSLPSEGLVSSLDRLLDLCGLAQGAPLEQYNIDPKGLRHLRVALWAKHLEAATGRMLWLDYFGKGPPEDTGFRAVADVEWTPAAILGLRLYGITQQLDLADKVLSQISHNFLELTRPAGSARTPTQLRLLRLELVERQLEDAERQTREMASDHREARVTAIAMHVDNLERDLAPLQQRLSSVGGIAVLRRIQEAELYHVRLETELYRIHQTAGSMRLRLARAEVAQLQAEVASLLDRWREADAAKQKHRNGPMVARPGKKRGTAKVKRPGTAS